MKKTCRQCGHDVRLADYYRHPRTADGVMAVCKACHRKNVSANYQRNKAHYQEYERGRANLPHRVAQREAYSQTSEGRAAHARSSRKQRQVRPLQRAARVAVGNALRTGRLIRQPCEVCGAERAQAHHDDYSKPLDVRWLCTTHHAEWHKHNVPLCPDQGQVAA